MTAEQKSKAVAVIFYKGTECSSGDSAGKTRMLGVGLKNTNSTYSKLVQWVAGDSSNGNTPSVQGWNIEIPTVCTKTGGEGADTAVFSGVLDGSKNYELLKSAVNDAQTASRANMLQAGIFLPLRNLQCCAAL